MKALIFSDIHGDLRALERLMDIEADHYFAAGDMATWSRGLEAIGRVLKRRAEVVHVLPGNHESERDISRMCEQFGLDAFHGRNLEIDGYQVAGLGYSTPTPFDTPGEYSEEEMARRLSAFHALDPLILICHCPPLGTTLDRIRAGAHAGSRAVLEFLETKQPVYFFCGHIHEAEGMTEKIGQTTAINVGKRGFLLDFDKIKEVSL